MAHAISLPPTIGNGKQTRIQVTPPSVGTCARVYICMRLGDMKTCGLYTFPFRLLLCIVLFLSFSLLLLIGGPATSRVGEVVRGSTPRMSVVSFGAKPPTMIRGKHILRCRARRSP